MDDNSCVSWGFPCRSDNPAKGERHASLCSEKPITNWLVIMTTPLLSGLLGYKLRLPKQKKKTTVHLSAELTGTTHLPRLPARSDFPQRPHIAGNRAN